ncbi:PROTEIN LURP-ONE-RELATED 4 [Salix purpurea]|uniref:PROTEIN LURP-ONE-RELATED 4 n=1 Tax=Salix purpurea TaxID=77065 RepID=A0A9Q0TIS4_SALPP|nr:PROTEIN LURP-ONE-RELATED 4 [Salix purpurea]
MAKVFPQSQRPTLDPFVSSERQTFTIWMKSLLCQTNGCTVFDSDGHVVYRVDNYDKKCRNKVYLMDLRGRVLVTIRRKRLQFFGCWYGYRWDSSANRENPWFQVRRKQLSSGITLGDDVLTLVVEPHVDHSLIMAIVTVVRYEKPNSLDSVEATIEGREECEVPL